VNVQLNFRSALDQVRIISRGARRRTLECFKINAVESKPRIKSLEPFVIVDKGPIIIAPYIEPVLQASLNDIHMALHVFYLFLAIEGCDAVLGNNDRDIKPRSIAEDFCQASRVNLPSEIGQAVAVDVCVTKLHTHLLERIEPKVDASIVVDAEKIELALNRDFDFHFARKGKFNDKDTGPESVDYRVIVEIVSRLLQEPVKRVPFLPGGKYGHIMRDADLSIGNVSMYEVVCFAVTGEYILKRDKGPRDVPETGGRATVEISANEDDIGLIECYPVSDISERRDHHLGVAQEFLNGCESVPGRPLQKPAGIGKVVERDHRFDVIASQDVDDFLVVGDGLAIPGVFARLDPAPLDGEAIGIDPQLLQKFEVLPEKGKVVRYLRDIT